ncbi:ethylbenzene dehydrogenase-related protein [Halodesulfurarchaeum sp. HSR-GB]|uniref:ethylbenzene dehydrogenase-related protein n=1 Tax=Halodesulfurarchaeum sp. HSR-GB TaxID=3074077 RepID=UPI0028605E2E|nr:ethylbenzene dehydrogenase-related protein [Halodesulfurarchaeum sp. HSR-GB]MDR5656435.1 ethylbenzene dehydrogenase-related protein [Halodesulfurarchaeum sp. HSR-GB]
MTAARQSTLVVAIATLVVASALFVPAIAAGVPANQVPVSSQPDAGDSLSQPTGDAWADVESAQVPLTSAPSGLPDASIVQTDSVTVQSAHTDDRIYVRLQWDDQTENASEAALDAYADGAAVQLPANVSTTPSVELGSQDQPVNLWYWTAADGAEEALAGGYNPGSITALEETTVQTHATHDGDTWTVVFERSLETDAPARADFDLETDVDIAFAVWDGANDERSGHHAYSEWYTLPLGPGDTGPAAQYLLWAVAGIGIVIALLIAARARGGD